MVASANTRTVGAGGWAAALSSRGLGQSILWGLMTLSVVSVVLAAPGLTVEQGGFQNADSRRDNGAFVQKMVRSEGGPGSAARARGQGERLGHSHFGTAPLARKHGAKRRVRARAARTRTNSNPSSTRTSSAADDEQENEDDDDDARGSREERKGSSSQRETSTTRRTTTSSTFSTEATSTSSAQSPYVFQAAPSTFSAVASNSATVASTAAEAVAPVPTAEVSASQPEALNSNESSITNKVAAAVAGTTSTVSAFSTQSKLFPAVVVIIVCGGLALLFLLFLAIRGYRWKQQERAEDIRRAQLAERGLPSDFGIQPERSRSSRIKAGARNLRKALSSERLGGAPPVQAQQGSVLLQVGEQVLFVPAEVAEEYQAAKRIYGHSSDMWNGRLYLSQCLARYERNEHLRGGAPYTPSPLSNVAAWNHSNSTLVSDTYSQDEKRMEEKHGLSSRLVENLRSLRSGNGADETDESIDPEKTGALNDSGPVVTRGSRQQWGITPSRSSSQTDGVEEPARRSSDHPYSPFTPQMMPSPITCDNFRDTPLPRQMSVLLRQKQEQRRPSNGSFRQTASDQRASSVVFSPRLIPLPASPLPEVDGGNFSLPADLPKVTLEDTPSQEARTRIVSRRLRSRLSTVAAMPTSSADAYGPSPSRPADSSPLHVPIRTAARTRAVSYAVGSEAEPIAARPRNCRASSVPVQNPQLGAQQFQLPLSTPPAAPTAAPPVESVAAEDVDLPSSVPLVTPPLQATAAPRWPSRDEERQRAVSSNMSPVSSRDRLQSARAHLEMERQRRQRGVSYSDGPTYHTGMAKPSAGPGGAQRQVVGSRYVSGPAVMGAHRKAAPVWTRQQSLD